MNTNLTASSEKDRENSAELRRQLLLYHLYRTEGRITLRELSRKVAASEVESVPDPIANDDSGVDSSVEDAVGGVYDSLSRRHLPVLVDRGVLEYDQGTDLVRPTDRLDDVLGVGENSRRKKRRKARYYAVSAVVLAAVTVVLEYGPIPHSGRALWWVTLAGVATLLFVASYRVLITSG